MKIIVLAFSCIIFSLSLFGRNGSTSVTCTDYQVINSLSELDSNPNFFQLEDIDQDVLILQVEEDVYESARELVLVEGDVQIVFEDRPPMLFFWNEELGVITSENNLQGTLFILSP